MQEELACLPICPGAARRGTRPPVVPTVQARGRPWAWGVHTCSGGVHTHISSPAGVGDSPHTSPGAWPRPKPAGVGLCQAPGEPARAHAPRPQGVLPQPWGVTSSARPGGWAAGGRALNLCLAPFLGKLPAPSTGAARAGPPSDTLPSSSPPHLGQRRHGTSHPPRRARGDGAPVSGSPAWPGGPNSLSWGFLGAMTEEEGAPGFTGDPLCAWTPPGHLSRRSGSPLRSVLLSPLGVGR